MALCGFCKRLKIRSTDFIFMIIMCVVLYFVYKYQFEEIKIAHKERKDSFDTLQQSCINGDDNACAQIREIMKKNKK
ncbi:hypothetical protein BKN38_05855 [Helicobacter sp. CLO-3]|uniref:hypothetical protein n=1 Tax=unclassified Helicobacter TaxID=2593540 RepID=UPI0008050AEB|nr:MULTISPECIES: hypothetical protein [unclassified Helicobacter]OBV29037.1 hypothetical protein BA723_07235 [Helicobacter sp. CLO-3]OHU83061.1 hypothetical protein BKN38_05855 [Helicobacter sp. CLO-3]